MCFSDRHQPIHGYDANNGLIPVHGPDRGFYRRGEGRSVPARANYKGQSVIREPGLTGGNVDGIFFVNGQRSLFHIADDADNGVPGTIARTDMETAADWISISEVTPGQRFADECGLRRDSSILFAQQAATDEPNPHRLAVVGADRVSKDVVPALCFLVIELCSILARNGWIVAERQQTGECRALNTGLAPNRIKCLLEKASAAFRAIGVRWDVVELVAGGNHLHGEQRRRSESRGNGDQPLHAAQQ